MVKPVAKGWSALCMISCMAAIGILYYSSMNPIYQIIYEGQDAKWILYLDRYEMTNGSLVTEDKWTGRHFVVW